MLRVCLFLTPPESCLVHLSLFIVLSLKNSAVASVTVEIVHSGSHGVFCLLWTLSQLGDENSHTGCIGVCKKNLKDVQPVRTHLTIYILCNLAMVFERKQD